MPSPGKERNTEAHVHIAIREHLKQKGWRLVAGQFPGGSDDEVAVLYVYDPAVARDDSPDPRRHSRDKLVPDLIALKGETLLIVEKKTFYSFDDAAKLRDLVTTRRRDLYSALRDFGERRHIPEIIAPTRLRLVPSMGFVEIGDFPRDPEFCYFLTQGLQVVRVLEPDFPLP